MTFNPSLPPLPSLAAVSAGRAAQHVRLVFALDERLAALRQASAEPLVRQIRLAWWREALSAEAASGEPLIDALHSLPAFPTLRGPLGAMVDGWEPWIAGGEEPRDMDLDRHARLRGGGLFAAIACVADQAMPDIMDMRGAIWALWDMCGRTRDEALRRRAIACGRELLGSLGGRPRLSRPLALLGALARRDLARGRGAPEAMTPALYLRVLRTQILGR